MLHVHLRIKCVLLFSDEMSLVFRYLLISSLTFSSALVTASESMLYKILGRLLAIKAFAFINFVIATFS